MALARLSAAWCARWSSWETKTLLAEDRSRRTSDREELTLLLDPRTGTIEPLTTPSPIVDLFWLGYSYGQAGGTVFVHGWDPGPSNVPEWGRICGFDTGTLEWDLCFEAPPGPQAREYSGYAAMVDDPINHRIVLINGRYGDWWRQTDAGVWAIDLRSGETLTLIAPAEAP